MIHECKFCKKHFKTGPKLGGHTVYCSKNPKRFKNAIAVSKGKMGFKMTDIQKKKISKSLKESHENGNHPGWSHINSTTKRSRPEEYFFNAISKDDFFKNVIEKKRVNRYFLDFALLDYKCDVEIDGVQHYREEKQINHDIKRNDFLINKGWRVYRIPAKLILINCELQIQKLKHWLLTNNKINDVNIEKTLKLYK